MILNVSNRLLRAALVSVLAMLFAAQVATAADPLQPNVIATPSNPYSSCTIGSGGPDTLNYTNAEVEPQVAVNPADTTNVIGVVQQDRWNDGGAHGLVAMVSHDGARSFHVVALPFSSCAPGGLPYERASDPWVSFGPDGTAYTVSISFDENSARNDVAAATSTDGGETWGNLTEIAAETDTYFHDKETVTADPNIAGTAYVVWDRVLDCCDYPGPSFFSKTTDYGATWSAPQQITAASNSHGDIGNLIVVNPLDGTLYDFFYRFYDSKLGKYLVMSSTDGGDNWSKPALITRDHGVTDSDPHPGGSSIRTGVNAIPQAAIDPATGRMYVVWEDARHTGGTVNQVLISTSTNGTRWSKPRRVSTKSGQPAFTPSVAVNALGQVAVTYYDFRAYDSSNAALPTGYWMKISPPKGKNFGPDIALRSKPFDMLTAPDAGGLFLGDYEGLAARGNSFVALYCGTTGQSGNATDCLAKVVNPNSGSIPAIAP